MQRLILVGAAFVLAAPLFAQSAEARFETREYSFDSGWQVNPGGMPGQPIRERVQFQNGFWLRLDLTGTNLDNGSQLRITSTLDGAVQFFDAASLAAYGHHSAYFNGGDVRVELFPAPRSKANRVKISSVEVGLMPAAPMESLCGGDDRALSSDPRQGRQYPTGCTSWLISESVVLTAGHCTSNPSQSVHFNVPLSSSTGSLRFPAPEHQYPYDSSTLSRLDAGIGADWAVARTVRNSNTGLFPGQAQGSWYSLGSVPGSTSGQVIRITGYGTTSSPVDPSWNQAQKTHADALTQIASTYLRYITDTTGGNSGSPVIHENTGAAIGIHTHAGCTSGGNHGTRIDRADLQAAIQNLLGGGGGAPAAPTGLTASASGSDIGLGWNDASNNEDGFQVERSTDGNSFQVVASLAADTTAWTDTGLAVSTTYWYRVLAFNGTGASAYSNIASATTAGGAVDYVVNAQQAVEGSVSGGIAATAGADGTAQAITEVYGNGNRPRNSLEHQWTIGGLPSGGTKTFMVLARQSASADGDAFEFQYASVNRRGKVSWNSMLTVSNTAYGGYATFVLPSSISGNLMIRVIDSNNSRGANGLDTVFVDHLLVRTQ